MVLDQMRPDINSHQSRKARKDKEFKVTTKASLRACFLASLREAFTISVSHQMHFRRPLLGNNCLKSRLDIRVLKFETVA